MLLVIKVVYLKNIYFSTLYYKTIPENDIYDFIPIRSLIGSYDEKTKCFTTYDGKVYFLLSDFDFLNSGKKFAIQNVLSLEECENAFNEKNVEKLFSLYRETFKKVYFLALKKGKDFFTVRYHEYMLLVGIGHLKSLVEIQNKQNFKRNLAKYGILTHSKIEKENKIKKEV